MLHHVTGENARVKGVDVYLLQDGEWDETTKSPKNEEKYLFASKERVILELKFPLADSTCRRLARSASMYWK